MMSVRILLVLLGVFHLANGLLMLAMPATWFQTVPGVAATGGFNHHFILDIGMAFIASGAFLVLGARMAPSASAFAIAGATWPLLHGLIHIAGWIEMGFPRQAPMILSEAGGVVLVGLAGGVLAWLRNRRHDHVEDAVAFGHSPL